MSYTVIPNPFTPGVEASLDELPLKPNGAQWRHCTIFNGRQSVVLSDDLAGIIAAHVDEYQEADFDRKELIREYLARHVQGVFNQTMSQNPSLTNEEKSEMLKEIPFSDHEGEDAPQWTSEVPLAVNVGDYAPHSDVKLPEGKVILIDPLMESRLVDSLQATGVIIHFER